jgi:hypothetical protein
MLERMNVLRTMIDRNSEDIGGNERCGQVENSLALEAIVIP